MNEIVIALIGAGASVIVGLFTLLGVVITNKNAKKEMIQKMEIAQAVTDTKIEELTREVREHNNFAKRMPVVENEIKHIEDDIHKLQGYHTRK
jgi:isochorismate hydrolase